TLLEYIKKVSDRGAGAGINQQNNAWDDLCICFIEAVDDILYRCQAIIKIAKRSSIPWSNHLREAVTKMFKAKGINAELRSELNIQCQTEELSKNYEIAPIKEAFGIMKSDYSRKAAAETLISMCISALEFCDPSLAETRFAAIDACSVVARSYLPITLSVERTLDIVNRLLQLQKSYGTMIPYSELTSRKKEVAEERLMEYCTGTPSKSFDEIVRFGELLLIT
uniref:Uncharacterized protein n=1 Tax=Panagrolaimus sp. ES5 TaxID=591445 RepID=A0AC34GHD8_9BILA